MFVFKDTGGIPLLLATGDVDVYNVEEFEHALKRLEGSDAPVALVSVEEVSFMCVRAFEVLASHAARAARSGRQLVLVCPENSFHRKILRLLRFRYAVASSVEDAADGLRRPGKAIAQT